jgi:hypothetical protein
MHEGPFERVPTDVRGGSSGYPLDRGTSTTAPAAGTLDYGDPARAPDASSAPGTTGSRAVGVAVEAERT